MTIPIRVPLFLEASRAIDAGGLQPVSLGVPFPKGCLADENGIHLLDAQGSPVRVQSRALACWSDGSVKWLLLDFMASRGLIGLEKPWQVVTGPVSSNHVPNPLRVSESSDQISIRTGPATFHVERAFGPSANPMILSLDREGKGETARATVGLRLVGAAGRPLVQHVETIALEASGPVRATVRVEGRFVGERQSCRFRVRFSTYAGSGLVRADVMLHNPRRAKHPGGLWDLGDPGSMLFREFALVAKLCASGQGKTRWSDSAGIAWREAADPRFLIHQESSGGENWASRNHLDRDSKVPLGFRGYRVQCDDAELTGLRAEPLVAVGRSSDELNVAVPGFWQEFPKSIDADGRGIEVGLFPGTSSDLLELQGGERKTHTVWLEFSDAGSKADLRWVHDPIVAHAAPAWYAASGAIPGLRPASENPGNPLDALLEEAGGPEGIMGRREIIDEYGWRHFGEVYADHEAEHYDGPHKPPVSHYNNQYDQVLGFALQFLRTGEPRWNDLFGPLARHVMDIDIYHTQDDKAAYNGGLFWFTDHYKDAATCTHRTYSKTNGKRGGRSYGGGPSAAHNFSSGLFLAHYLTGDPDARAAVLELADWVIGMDDGRKTPLGLIDSGPTGLASFTFDPNYHGPGRGCGNSIAVLLDGWTASGDRKYLEKAEELIRRSIHPDDDVDARDLLNVELRWSYTIFLSSLAKYLDLKAEAGAFDAMYTYARTSLLRYALWMLDHEVPYFDRRDRLEFPTEAWAGQELRKGNVMRMAAEHAQSPARESLARRGDELIERAWSDLFSFGIGSRTSARALALAMNEGTRAVASYGQSVSPAPAPNVLADQDFGPPREFVPQKRRVLGPLLAVRRLIKA